jgi:hypothetical protein
MADEREGQEGRSLLVRASYAAKGDRGAGEEARFPSREDRPTRAQRCPWTRLHEAREGHRDFRWGLKLGAGLSARSDGCPGGFPPRKKKF